MDRYDVGGMSCAACSARVEKAVSAVDGVEKCSVNLLTNSMTVEGSATPDSIINAVTKAGYTANIQGSQKSQKQTVKAEKPNEVKPMLKRFFISLFLLLILMYFSMGHTMWGFPLPPFFTHNHIAIALTQLLLSTAVMVINKRFFISGFKGLIHKAPNMDTLVSLGSAASYIWSIYELYAMTVSDADTQMSLMHGLYFESAAMILVLITLGKILEAHSKGKTTDSLRALMDLNPKTALIERDGKEIEVPVEEVNVGDIFILRPGMSVPADGVVIEGESSIDESMLTGESLPVDKTADSKLYSATINQNGFLRCKATRVGEDTTLSQIIKTVYDAGATKAPIARIADKVSGIFVPVVISIALFTFAVWLLTGAEFAYALERGISVLVISCPCALGLATPVSIMVGNGVGARAGILFKNAEALETAGKTQIIALDKTGTVTKGEPEVTDVIPLNGAGEAELLQIAYSIERLSSHPLAAAVSAYAKAENTAELECTDFENLSGHGLRGKISGKEILAGSKAFIEKHNEISADTNEKLTALADMGKTPMLFTKDGKLIGVIAAADTVKDDSKKAVKELKELGIKVVMLTGDNERTAKAIGDKVGIDRVYAGVLPSGKSEIVEGLKKSGRTAMVGDGINDAPALTSADTGIAIGSGSDIAIDSADVVLIGSKLSEATAAIRLSRQTLKNIRENLFWAFIYNIIGIPLAAGLWIPIFGLTLSPMFGAAAMSLSSFCVVTNALRLNLFDPHKHKKSKKSAVALPKSEITTSAPVANSDESDRIIPSDSNEKSKNAEAEQSKSASNNNEKGEIKMTTTVKVEGMMCPNCERHVREAIMNNFEGNVTEAVASHTDGKVVVTSASALNPEVLKTVIADAGYTYKGIE